MSRIEKLIEEKCPSGVSFYALGEIAKIQRGDRITKKDITDDGEYPVMSGGVNSMGRYRMNNRNANTITISSYGAAGFVNFLKEEFWANDVCLSVFPKDVVDNKYLYYALKAQQQYIFDNTTKAIPNHIPTRFLEELMIPVPPLVIQKEIVGVLDSFTELEAKLEAELGAELEARRKQYEHYRDQLLSFENLSAEGGQVEWLTLGGVCDTITDYVAAGSFADLAKKVKYLSEPDYALLVRTMDIKNDYTSKRLIYISEDAYNYLWRVRLDGEESLVLPNIGNCGEVYYIDGDLPYERCALATNAILVRSSKVSNKFLYYLFQAKDFQKKLRKIISPVGQTKFNKTDFKKIVVPVPTKEIQDRVVEKMKAFDLVSHSLEAGLPAEIEARHKQYVYYRDKLLTFKEKTA